MVGEEMTGKPGGDAKLFVQECHKLKIRSFLAKDDEENI